MNRNSPGMTCSGSIPLARSRAIRVLPLADSLITSSIPASLPSSTAATTLRMNSSEEPVEPLT
ncbi:MAG: hypothetical protein R2715_01865 [Ilumatobacteraceae bacterium]